MLEMTILVNVRNDHISKAYFLQISPKKVRLGLTFQRHGFSILFVLCFMLGVIFQTISQLYLMHGLSFIAFLKEGSG